MTDVLNHPMLQQVQSLAAEQGARAYLVGGAVRDWRFFRELPDDLDIMLTDGSAAALADALAERAHGRLVPLDWAHGIHRVVFGGGLTVDVSDALNNDRDQDLARRDLTVNAMAIDLATGAWLDPFGGQADLEARRICMVSETNLIEDPLRLLRVFRIGAGLQAQAFDPATLEAVARHHQAITHAAAERVQYELLRLLDARPCFPYLSAMAESGLLDAVLPELAPMRAIPASGFHHLGLYEHSLELVHQAEHLIDAIPDRWQDWITKPFNASVSRFALLKLACLLHDIGKPDTMGHKSDPLYGERLTFYGHEEVGEVMADARLRALKCSNEAREYVKKLIRWHLYPCQFGPDSPRKSVLRFYRRMGEETPDVVLLALADRHSSRGPWLTPEDFEASHRAHLWLLENYAQEEPVLQTPRLLNGHEVMAALGLSPGPHLKDILDALQEAQHLGEIHTPDEACQWLRERYGPRA